METTVVNPDPLPINEIREANRARFELELEFVQSLANPHYLYSLGSVTRLFLSPDINL
jgi:hypothetical protein